MPIYEYLCESCGMVNEKLQKLTDPPPGRCDECGSKKLAKLVSRSAFPQGRRLVLRFYASKEKEAPAKEGAEAAPAEKPATEAKAGATPENKAETAPAATTPPAKAATTDRPAKKDRKKAAMPAPSTWPSGPACPSRTALSPNLAMTCFLALVPPAR